MSTKAKPLPVNLDVLNLMVQRAGGLQEVAKRLPKIESWLKGEETPTVKNIKGLEGLSNASLIPFGFLFGHQLPRLIVHEGLFRRKKIEPRISPEFDYTLTTMKLRQDFLLDYHEYMGIEQPNVVGSASNLTNPHEVADIIRQRLSLPVDWAKQLPNWKEAFRYLRDKIEAIGIYVFTNSVVGNNNRRRLEPDEFSGFALVDRLVPVIFVNTRDWISSQIFTLVHELCHVFLYDEDDVFVFRGFEKAYFLNKLESLTNRVAGEFLVPEELLRDYFLQKPSHEELARTFKVSQYVIAIRLKQIGLIGNEEYKRILDDYKVILPQKERRARTGGGDFYAIQRTKLGKRFIQTVAQALNEGLITFPEACRLTGLKRGTLSKLLEAVA